MAILLGLFGWTGFLLALVANSRITELEKKLKPLLETPR